MTEAVKLDEVALRKPGFHEGARVTLADGQEWALPELWHRFVPVFDEGRGDIVAEARVTYGPEHDRDLDLIMGGVEVEPLERMDALMRLPSRLLMANYSLTYTDLATLIPRDDRDERLRAMWKALLPAILGLSAPKA